MAVDAVPEPFVMVLCGGSSSVGVGSATSELASVVRESGCLRTARHKWHRTGLVLEQPVALVARIARGWPCWIVEAVDRRSVGVVKQLPMA